MRTLFLAVLIAAPLCADVEDRTTETRTFPNGHLLIVDNINGSIEANGYSGSDVQVEVARHITAESAERLEAARREVKVDMQQSGDTVKLYVDGPFRCNCDCNDGHGWNNRGHTGYSVTYDFKIRVPSNSRVDLYTVNHGQVAVHNVTGDFDVRNVNGGVEITGAGGSGKAHTVNGPVKVVFVKNPTAPSSFETVNGSVDLTFRPGLAADLQMETMHGELLTDFDVTTLPAQHDESERRGGKFVFHRHGTGVRIGSGGPEIKTKTLNGDIFIRDGGKSGR